MGIGPLKDSLDFRSGNREILLKNFFELDTPFTTFTDPEELTKFLQNSNDLRNVLFRPDALVFEDLNVKRDFFTDKTFTNVSFSKTEIYGVVFKDCKFVDCLFIGTRFVACEFRRCIFVTCNPHEVEFKNTLIDPAVFEGMIDTVEYTNIGSHLFQALYKNATETQQITFIRTAEFNLKKWERYELEYRYPGWSKFKHIQGVEWLINLLSHVVIGYGIRGKFLILWGIIFALTSVAANYVLWDDLNIIRSNGAVSEGGIIEVVYYTGTILGGFSDLSPGSDVGKLLLLVQLGFGLLLVSLFVRWLIRLALR